LSLALQGFRYYVNSLTWDPVTLAAIVMALFVAAGAVAAGRRVLAVESDGRLEWWKYLAVAMGIVLYLVYIVRIGGDFMSGRFFAAPLLASCTLLVTATSRWPRWSTAGLTAVTLVLGAWPSCAPLRSGSDYGWPDVRKAVASGVWKAPLYDEHGIADERAFYYGGCGLLRAPCDRPFPTYDFEHDGRSDCARAADTPVVVCACVGIRGFYGGPDVHYVDTLALGDPLLSKLPARDADKSRVGHWERALPGGYLETLKTGENCLEDPRLKIYYDRLTTVIRGDLFDAERIREVARMARGRYNVLLVDQPRVPPQ
jgi:arabinofuranosyltransferase